MLWNLRVLLLISSGYTVFVPRPDGTATVLLVDDDPIIRDLFGAILRGAGYRVEVASDGQEAQAFFCRNSNAVQLLLTDVEMPLLSGIDLADSVAAAGSRCPVLLMSGRFPPPEIAKKGWAFLQKPFTPAVLIRTVEELILPLAARPTALLAEDDDAMRNRLCGLIDGEYDVIEALKGGASVLEKSKELHPDIIILDISMPEMNGLEVARALRGSVPEIPVVFVTQHGESAYVEAAFASGAAGYVTKTRAFTELRVALQEVLAGGQYLSTDLRPR